MPRYNGPTAPVRADEVQVGDRLVHQDGPDGWIEVEDVEARGDGIVLSFTDGEEEQYWAGDTVWRVTS